MALAIDYGRKYSYADYLNWPDEERWEIIDGVPYNMSPAPRRKHQAVVGKLFYLFYGFFEDKSCEVYLAPFDVRLAEDFSDDHIIEQVVQPDISVFCDKSKLDDKGAIGAPDLVVEILSPATAEMDMKTKLLLYQKYGVKEYWIVDTDKETIERFVLDDLGKYNPGKVFIKDQVIISSYFENLKINLKEVFAD